MRRRDLDDSTRRKPPASLASGIGLVVATLSCGTEPPTPTTVTVSPATAEFTAVGSTSNFTAEVLDQNGVAMSEVALEWSSSDPGVVQVDASGVATSVANGTAMVTARARTASDAATVVVVQVVAGVVVTPDSVEFNVLGEMALLSAEARDANGNAVEDAAVTWSSSDPWVAAVDSDGLVTSVYRGVADIVAEHDVITGLAKAVVTPDPDRDALVALYEATGGENWTNNKGWLTEESLGDWYGVGVDERRRVVSLILTDTLPDSKFGLKGDLPSELSGLSELVMLDLRRNDLGGEILFGLKGDLPSELSGLSELVMLDLRRNDLGGEIPPELAEMQNLEELLLAANSFSGKIPKELGDLSELRGLNLAVNSLSGAIPPELGNLSNLRALVLNVNDISGAIPPELANLERLGQLSLGYNDLSGAIPPWLGDLSGLSWLDLGGNELSGAIPPELGDLVNLRFLFLDFNDLSGAVPPDLGHGRLSLWVLYLDNNSNLSGPLPRTFLRLGLLEYLHWDETDLCAPADSVFQAWVDDLTEAEGETCEGDG